MAVCRSQCFDARRARVALASLCRRCRRIQRYQSSDSCETSTPARVSRNGRRSHRRRAIGTGAGRLVLSFPGLSLVLPQPAAAVPSLPACLRCVADVSAFPLRLIVRPTGYASPLYANHWLRVARSRLYQSRSSPSKMSANRCTCRYSLMTGAKSNNGPLASAPEIRALIGCTVANVA